MDYRALECFIAVAEELHFGRAAVRLHLTQPSLTTRIRVLEREVGTPLFERDRRHVALTPAGTAFLDDASLAAANILDGIRRARQAASGEIGSLRFGFTGLTTFGRMPELVQQFRLRFPAVDVELIHADTAKLEAGLQADEIDIALLHPPLTQDRFERLDFPPEDLILALPASSELAAMDLIPIARLAQQPFLISPRRNGPHLYDQIIQLCRSEGGFSPLIVQEVTTMTTLIGLAAAGLGSGFVLRSLDIIRHPGVVYRPVVGKAPAIATSLVWRENHVSKTARNLIGIANSAMKTVA